MIPQERQRFTQLMNNVPQLFEFADGKKLLYVGASPSRFQFGKELQRCGYDITILEPWLENAMYYRHEKKMNVIHERMDTDLAEGYCDGNKFDVVFWWHGPEHVKLEFLPNTLKEIERITSELIVLGCPWGEYPQDAVGGNPYEEHLSTLDKDFFESLGYNVDTVGEMNVPNKNNLLAWKEMK